MYQPERGHGEPSKTADELSRRATVEVTDLLNTLNIAQVFPLEVVRRRMQTLAAEGISQKGAMGIRQAVLDIWAKEKLRGFYAGMLPNTIQVQCSSLPSYVLSCVHDLR